MKPHRGPQLLMLLGVLLPLSLFFFPLWVIILEAAQFPEGLWMYIWIDKISGSTEYILQNVNILNHYIGMQPIVPESIPELVYFPWVVVTMSILGILAVITNKGKWFVSWFVLMSILGILGIYDFYLWLVDYGTNLDPKAPIKVPGMTYQPPLIGTKNLLNFVAHSYPATGGVLLGVGLLVTAIAGWWKLRLEKRWKIKKTALSLLLPLGLLLGGCNANPVPIAFGEDHCDYCRMTISDPKFGAELVNHKGKVWKYDALECLVHHMDQDEKTEADFAHILAVPYNKPGELFPVHNLRFLVSPNLPSPMGANLSAYTDETSIDKMHQENSGIRYTWAEIPNLILPHKNNPNKP